MDEFMKKIILNDRKMKLMATVNGLQILKEHS